MVPCFPQEGAPKSVSFLAIGVRARMLQECAAPAYAAERLRFAAANARRTYCRYSTSNQWKENAVLDGR